MKELFLQESSQQVHFLMIIIALTYNYLKQSSIFLLLKLLKNLDKQLCSCLSGMQVEITEKNRN